MCASHLPRTPLLLSLAALLFASACTKDELEQVRGELVVIERDDSGTERQTRESTIDFGAVFGNAPQTRTVVVGNLGKGVLVLSELTVEGSGEAGTFESDFTSGISLGPSEKHAFEITFRPNGAARTGEAQAVWHLKAENAAEGLDTVTLRTKARLVGAHCALPEKLEFGSVLRNTSEELSITVSNPTDVEVEAFVGPLSGIDAAAFALQEGSPTGAFAIPAGEKEELRFRFSPTEERTYSAFVRVRAGDDCDETMVLLTGEGVRTILSWPLALEFGHVPPGTTEVRTVTFTNRGNLDVEIQNVTTSVPSEFVPALKTLTVPARGSADLDVRFSTTTLGPRGGVLQFSTSIAAQRSGAVQLHAFSGGPDIVVTPGLVNFGRVPYFSGANLSQNRRVWVRNVGSKRDPKLPEGNLLLDPSWATVVPQNTDTTADEFTVTVSPLTPYDAAVGLEPKADAFVEFVVTLTPRSAARKEATVTFRSNDPDQPEVTVSLVADAVVLPPCEYSVSPTQIDFGVVAPPDSRKLAFSITNHGQNPGEICLISDLRLETDSAPLFTLIDGPQPELELAPGETRIIEVGASPQNATSSAQLVHGSVTFYVSSPTRPDVGIPLRATLVTSCITLAPSTVDFGTVKLGCGSVTRTVSLYNACPVPAVLREVSLVLAGGQPAGGANCPGTSACPEYALLSSPAIPAAGLTLAPGGAPTTLQLRYTPIDLGTDPGVLGVKVDVSGQNQLYTTSLTGTGDTTGVHTDVYANGGTPVADILLSIDGSCSMASKQTALANNMTSFFAYATSTGVDYRIAVIKGQGPGSNTTVGHFLSGPTHPDKILTPHTPNVELQFKEKVNVGANGGDERCFDPSLQALTGTLAGGLNAGFLRPHAPLAIICITDDSDYSPDTVAYYEAALRNVKGGDKSMLTVNAIAGFTQSCSATLLENGRYAQMVAATGGQKEEVCATDWAKALENISKKAFGARGTYFLTAVPDPSQGAISVTLDGNPVPASTSLGQPIWSWDPVSNAVIFEPLYLPPPGSSVEIVYPTTCL